MKKSVLLTGGSGFIGRNLRESVLREKYDVFTPSHDELDLTDTASVDAYFKGKTFDAVLHAAAKAGHRNAKDPSNLFRDNVRMFLNLERRKDCFGKFVNFGSGAIYGLSGDVSNASENAVFKAMGADDHGFCKYAVAKYIENLPHFVDLNIFGIFGKYEDFEIRFISNAICKTLFNLPVTLRQNRRFSYLDVDDLPPILEFFIENDVRHHSYNIVPDKCVELADVASLVRDVSGENVEIQIAKDGYGFDYYGDNARLKAEMPAVRFTPLKTSIERLFAYYKSVKASLNRDLFLKDK